MEARRRFPCNADALESLQLQNSTAGVSCPGSHTSIRYVPSTEEFLMRSPGVLWIKAAVVYLVMGVGLGIYMGASVIMLRFLFMPISISWGGHHWRWSD